MYPGDEGGKAVWAPGPCRAGPLGRNLGVAVAMTWGRFVSFLLGFAMTSRMLIPLMGLAIAAMLVPIGQAWADAIDGEWCVSDGRYMTIDGPKILTPGGTRMTGNYDRHGFSYTVPSGETGAGSTVSMVLVNDDTIHLTMSAEAQAEVWRRCTRPTV